MKVGDRVLYKPKNKRRGFDQKPMEGVVLGVFPEVIRVRVEKLGTRRLKPEFLTIIEG